MFKISVKAYKVIFPIWTSCVLIGLLSHDTFIPSDGYKTFSYLAMWGLAIWLAIVSAPHMQAHAKRNNLFFKNVPPETRILISTIGIAYVNGFLFFQFIPLITKPLATSEHTAVYQMKSKEFRPQRAFLACDQYLKLNDSFYFGKLCVTKRFFNQKKSYDMIAHSRDTVRVSGYKNTIGFYVDLYQ